MSVLVDKEFSFYISSASGNLGNNVTLSSDNSRLTVNLDRPVQFSSSSVYTTLEVEQASIYNTSYNISAALGNNQFGYSIATVGQPTLTIPDGLYSIETLNDEIVRQIVNAGNPSTTITMAGNLSTQRAVLTFDANVQANFTVANSCREVVGFNSRLSPLAPVAAVYSESGDTIAAFNNTNNFNILSNIVSEGIQINNIGRNLIASIPISAGVGSIVNYTPFNPSKSVINQYRGKTLQNFYVQIADDSGVALSQNEDWSVLLTFREKILVTDKKVPMLDI